VRFSPVEGEADGLPLVAGVMRKPLFVSFENGVRGLTALEAGAEPKEGEKGAIWVFVEMAQDVAGGGVHKLVRKHAVLDAAGAADRCACRVKVPNP
jgi:hypothetical protein